MGWETVWCAGKCRSYKPTVSVFTDQIFRLGCADNLPHSNHIQEMCNPNKPTTNDNDLSGPDDGDAISHSGDKYNDNEKGITNLPAKPGKKNLPAEAIEFPKQKMAPFWGGYKPSMGYLDMQIFRGYRTAGDKVPLSEGIKAKACLKLLNAELYFRQHKGLRHCYSPHDAPHPHLHLGRTTNQDRHRARFYSRE